MPFCTKCGQQISDTSKFCTKCGHPLIKPAQQNPGSVLFVQKENQTGKQPDETIKDSNVEIPTPQIERESGIPPVPIASRGGFFTTNKKRILIFASLIGTLGILVLAYFIFIKKESNSTGDGFLSKPDSSRTPSHVINSPVPLQNKPRSVDSLKNLEPKDQLPTNVSDNPNQVTSDIPSLNSTNGSANPELKPLSVNIKDPKNIIDDDKDPGNFTYLTVNQIKRDLLNKPLCEGLTYTGEDQKLIILGGLPDNIYQKKLDLFGGVTVKIQFKDDTESKSCSVEIFYKKGNNKFNLITYVQK